MATIKTKRDRVKFASDNVTAEDLGDNNSLAIKMMKEAGWD